eukprot:scaffold1616_cov310-Pinguiococcus_pyrenoidosus.AAC.31
MDSSKLCISSERRRIVSDMRPTSARPFPSSNCTFRMDATEMRNLGKFSDIALRRGLGGGKEPSSSVSHSSSSSS